MLPPGAAHLEAGEECPAEGMEILSWQPVRIESWGVEAVEMYAHDCEYNQHDNVEEDDVEDCCR